MKRLNIGRDAWILIALLVLLGGFSAFVAIRRAQLDEANQVTIPYSTHSTSDSGTQALFDWLAQIGYQTRRIEYSAFRIGDDVRLLFVLAPTEQIEKSDAQYMLNWVERGNVLYVADDGFFTSSELFNALNVQLDSLNNSVTGFTLEQPFVDGPSNPVQTSSYSGLQVQRNDFVEYAGSAGKPLLIRIPYGKGTIWVSSTPDILTNAKLRTDANARFAAAVAATVPAGSVIAFDEYHLGFKGDDGNSFIAAMYNTPWGWGFLFALFLIFGYLIITGRRFGRVIPVQTTLARRTPSEYVVSMANLFRRANKRGMVLQHYRHSLKRRLGRAFHLNPDLSDDRYLELISRMRPELDRNELARLLAALRRSDTTEADLVKTVEHSITFGARPDKT